MKKLTSLTLIGIALLLTGCTPTTDTATKTEIEKPPEKKVEVMEEKNVYKNDEFGFQITLTDNWKDYIVVPREIPNGKLLDFSSATKFTGSGYAELFNISILTIAGWDKERAECLALVDDPGICDYNEIGRSATHVFDSGHINGFPQDDQVEALADYDKIIGSFTVLN